VTSSATAHPTPDRLLAWRVGRLSEAAAAEVDQHIAACESCRGFADALQPELLRTLLAAPTVGMADTPAAPSDVPTAVHEMATLPPTPAPQPAVSTSPPAIPPELVDHPRYRVLGLLGVGGMGSVYKAEHRIMERLVALKVINRNLTDDPNAIERFRREVRTAARLTHPNIVTAFDADHVGDLHFLVMEYVEGNSLDKWVNKVGPLAKEEACNYVRQAALGLQYAHERGMVHRDVKPQNMLRTKDGEIKILDFGLARFASERRGNDSLTGSGVLMGTPDYIAPEQANDARTADIRADIYSLGCTLYYLLTAQVPFPEDSTLQKFIAHMEKTPYSIREYRRDLPVALEAVVLRMMAKKPEDRFQQPLDVANAVAPFLPGAAPPTPPPTLLEPVYVEAEEADIPMLKLAVIEEAVLVEPAPLRKFSSRPRPRQWERREDKQDELEIVQHDSEEALLQQRIRLSRQLGIASVVCGVLALPVTFASCLIAAPALLAVIGLGLGAASGILTYKAGSARYGWTIAGLCLNIVALMSFVGNDLTLDGIPSFNIFHAKPATTFPWMGPDTKAMTKDGFNKK
jgi:serine/threonine protein kinase